MAQSDKYLIVICGPTASGKTAVSIQLARQYQTEILSTDSRQIYRELSIGTAKPSPEELAAVPHHFIDSVSVEDEYSAGQFERDALALLEELYRKHDLVIAAGGTGLYIRALSEGFDDIPPVDPSIRDQIIREFEEKGLVHLQREAESADPGSYAVTDTQNPQRLMRLIEVYRGTGKPRSSYIIGNKPAERPFHTIKIGLELEREVLYERINRRVDDMMRNGLLEEAEQLHPHKSLNALQTVGYSELIEYLDGSIDLEEAVTLIKRNSRRYAKRQLTWFRRDADIHWFTPEDISGIIQYIDALIKR